LVAFDAIIDSDSSKVTACGKTYDELGLLCPGGTLMVRLSRRMTPACCVATPGLATDIVRLTWPLTAVAPVLK
jgi:hypothetical protein